MKRFQMLLTAFTVCMVSVSCSPVVPETTTTTQSTTTTELTTTTTSIAQETGGYPWADAPFPNSMPDPWGMYKRQSVSYTAWKIDSTGRFMPYWGGRGNANQWDDNARAAGIPVDGNPRVGDVAVNNSGFYGQVMYVEEIIDSTKIKVSQYNASWDGNYSTAVVSIAALQFIHFP